MPKRTQIVCLHEGVNNNVDRVFINRLLKKLDLSWIRPYKTGDVRLVCGGGRNDDQLYRVFVDELRKCSAAGGNTTLIVLSDVDDLDSPNALQTIFDNKAREAGLSCALDKVVYIFPKNRIENWFEYLLNGSTNESQEGRRRDNEKAREAAEILAQKCTQKQRDPQMPPSLKWSCEQWNKLTTRMKG
ncbi:hypothetical protein AGMMS50229_04640 [Campylobacterota bacterium]|nr:hypothetical protein AGMMS50229_04640 [Campylobacterota bacterium]